MENCVVPAERNARSDAVIYSEYAECEIGAELESVRVAVEKLRRYCLRFGLDPGMARSLKAGALLSAGIDHPEYSATVERVDAATRASLAIDLA